MSTLLVMLLTVIALPPSATRDDIVLFEASDLVGYCRSEAEAYYVGKGHEIYQWAASHKSRGNVLYVDGRLRVDHDDIQVACRLPKGARLTYMTLEVSQP